MSGLIQSTSTEFFRVSTSAYISFIMQQIQLELDILFGAASRISVEIVQPLQ
jgi:uncharacterized membrane protein (UPF0127 family)